jgi:poly(A) polymerase
MNLLEHRRFRAAYDFMVLQSEAGFVDKDIATFWTEVQTQSAEERANSFQLQAQPSGRKRRRRKRKPRSGSVESG